MDKLNKAGDFAPEETLLGKLLFSGAIIFLMVPGEVGVIGDSIAELELSHSEWMGTCERRGREGSGGGAGNCGEEGTGTAEGEGTRGKEFEERDTEEERRRFESVGEKELRLREVK